MCYPPVSFAESVVQSKSHLVQEALGNSWSVSQGTNHCTVESINNRPCVKNRY